eukprot:scaffold144986_cov28-Tisochrysis_lutea.AAC.5
MRNAASCCGPQQCVAAVPTFVRALPPSSSARARAPRALTADRASAGALAERQSSDEAVSGQPPHARSSARAQHAPKLMQTSAVAWSSPRAVPATVQCVPAVAPPRLQIRLLAGASASAAHQSPPSRVPRAAARVHSRARGPRSKHALVPGARRSHLSRPPPHACATAPALNSSPELLSSSPTPEARGPPRSRSPPCGELALLSQCAKARTQSQHKPSHAHGVPHRARSRVAVVVRPPSSHRKLAVPAGQPHAMGVRQPGKPGTAPANASEGAPLAHTASARCAGADATRAMHKTPHALTVNRRPFPHAKARHELAGDSTAEQMVPDLGGTPCSLPAAERLAATQEYEAKGSAAHHLHHESPGTRATNTVRAPPPDRRARGEHGALVQGISQSSRCALLSER